MNFPLLSDIFCFKISEVFSRTLIENVTLQVSPPPNLHKTFVRRFWKEIHNKSIHEYLIRFSVFGDNNTYLFSQDDFVTVI